MTLATSVVRGILSRTSPAPWSIHQESAPVDDDGTPVGPPHVTILDGHEEPVAHVELRTASYENPSLIAAAPQIAADYLLARSALFEVDQALRAAGIEVPGARGVRELEEYRTRAEREAHDQEERVRLGGQEALAISEEVEELTAQLGRLRALLATFRDRELTGPGADLYRGLVGVLMTLGRPTGDAA